MDWNDRVDWSEPSNMSTTDLADRVDERVRMIAETEPTAMLHVARVLEADEDRVFTYLVLHHVLQTLGAIERRLDELEDEERWDTGGGYDD